MISAHLHVGVSTCLDQELHAECSMVGPGGIVKWGLPLLVKGVDHGLVLKEHIDDHVLAVVAGDVQGSAAKEVDNINLETSHTHTTTKNQKDHSAEKYMIPINATHITSC